MSELWNSIDLSKHGVIEAHAGTGKTFTIAQLVLRILETPAVDSNKVHIREILLVTYTEKAAGELKKRIRDELVERIAVPALSDETRTHLENCLNNIHEAYIGTIHSICLRLLQTWPFESGIPFETEITDDTEGLTSALRESMRSDWQNSDTCIPWALRKMASSGIKISKNQFELICKTAEQLLDDVHTGIDRSITGGLTLHTLKSLLESDGTEYNLTPLYPDFIACIEEYLDVIDDILADSQGLFSNPILTELTTRKTSWREQLDRMGYISFDFSMISNYDGKKRLCTTKTRQHPLFAKFDELQKKIKSHLFLKIIAGETIFLTLVCDAAELLARLWKQEKDASGLVSYADMLQLMLKAVTGNSDFTLSLRSRLKYAIIDEFQDTSSIQWKIFRTLFVDNPSPETPRLYLVGDPKQSIYMFQGADVHSYLDARSTICSPPEKTYKLSRNYRSLPETIRGYNTIFASSKPDENSDRIQNGDWFLSGEGKDGISYYISDAAKPADRSLPPENTLPVSPVQVMALKGKKPERIDTMAKNACSAIRHLAGTTISIPEGTGWKELTLTYGDFAVIVESHNLAQPFLDHLRSEGIPAVKYKMTGIFQSPAARALHTLLGAIHVPSGDPAPRLAALLTPFFNRQPAAIDPEHDLEPCVLGKCRGDNLCIAHALEEWTSLAVGSFWAQLFESIQRLSGIRERFLRLRDGERHLADLKQLTDYCLTLLYQRNFTLAHLIEHLGGMLDDEDNGGQGDTNLHVLETQKSSVRVLTIHAAKGLEFPVVFVVTGGSKKAWSAPAFIRYTAAIPPKEKTAPRTLIAPYLSVEDIRVKSGGTTPEQSYLEQTDQERRRLLYVACTRAQALLFVPMHLSEIPEHFSSWNNCTPASGADRDLTPRLQHLLDNNPDGSDIALFDEHVFRSLSHAGKAPDMSRPFSLPDGTYPDIDNLKLLSRICRQTSYSQLSREAPVSREVDKSEESDEPEENTGEARTASPLPGGKTTGDALHCTLEEILIAEDAHVIAGTPENLRNIVEKYLKRNGIIARLQRTSGGSEQVVENAVTTACACIAGALSTRVTLPGGGILEGVASLPRADRLPEMEFLLSIDPHWAHGFMDLVFRIGNPTGGNHPWRYYVLDWKSDTLPSYTGTVIDECIRRRHYDLQARLYSHALDRYLSGILGSGYDPAEHLGGAVYLFLREHEKSPQKQATPWTYTANPREDATFVRNKLRIQPA